MLHSIEYITGIPRLSTFASEIRIDFLFIYINVLNYQNMKAMYKSELAAYAGVTTRTLRRWLKPYQQQLAELGMKPKDQIVKPSAVKFICETLCIDIYP